MTDVVDCVVVGAGVVGLAVARAMALRGREVMVLESADAIGTGTSSRNSEVIHAGLYYSTGSLKARLCVQGKEMLYAYCAERGVPHRRCGKLLVATSAAQLASLESIQERAQANGVLDLQWLSRDAALALEPALECVGALHSPSTGIVDSHALMLALQGDLEHAGGIVALNSPLALAEYAQDAINLEAKDGTRLQARTVINAAGLSAPALAACFAGLAPAHVPAAHYAKGSYFTLAGKAPFSHLIYPVPEAAGLGVHLTLDLGGQAKFGPDVQWVESADDLLVDPARGDAFYAEVRKYWPALQDGALAPGYAGIRPKIHGANAPAADFVIQGPAVHGVPGLVNLFGIESPGLTSALAIAEHVAALV
ncbi:L-2-hydroxyglutarate oxidase LhgO [Acidovorax sp. 69]|uniref:NAD(P)/FAD-dependent oxidoreductase n=1 Tax=Acidovorax sp. 69 TaxID=2035202 RepID=UPI000C233A65|nr:NAD(P)/FAD-dependent oxidoreductase [Acidovorax sp. 69]PJI97684.1 L-2-hydroxyglutarate oxidase LhgO [Acidovorax sp. 69]